MLNKEQIVDAIGEALIAAHYLLDDSVHVGDEDFVRIHHGSARRLERALDVLEAWPDEPGYQCGPASSAQWAIKSALKAMDDEIARLRACLVSTRHEICKGPVDDVLWHQSTPACTTVDNITFTLGDEWSYDDWLSSEWRLDRERKHAEIVQRVGDEIGGFDQPPQDAGGRA